MINVEIDTRKRLQCVIIEGETYRIENIGKLFTYTCPECGKQNNGYSNIVRNRSISCIYCLSKLRIELDKKYNVVSIVDMLRLLGQRKD